MSLESHQTITDEQALWLWKCILGRDPESPEALDQLRGSGKTFAEGRRFLIASEEFRSGFTPPTHTYYIPEDYRGGFVKSPDRSLCLATIVKNEAVRIENLLLSCIPLLDFVVIVDTGSSDETVSVAQMLLQSVEIPFLIAKVPFQDFAQARNSALERVPVSMDWVLMLDADEEIVPADYERFASLIEADDVDAWHLPRFNFVDEGKRKPVEHYPDFQLRLLRNKKVNPIRFVHKVHERPNINVWRDAPIALCEVGQPGGPHIHHLGGINLSKERWQEKHDLYVRLMADDPPDR